MREYVIVSLTALLSFFSVQCADELSVIREKAATFDVHTIDSLAKLDVPFGVCAHSALAQQFTRVTQEQWVQLFREIKEDTPLPSDQNALLQAVLIEYPNFLMSSRWCVTFDDNGYWYFRFITEEEGSKLLLRLRAVS